MNKDLLFDYKGTTYPKYLCHGNACQYIAPIATKYCIGLGLDVGANKWPLSGAIPVELENGGDAMDLPPVPGGYDYVFSSHCLEHLVNPVVALEHWKDNLRPGGVLLLYLPHPDQKYWRPTHNRRHLHAWWPKDMAQTLSELGFVDVLHSERDLAWSFAVVGFKPGAEHA